MFILILNITYIVFTIQKVEYIPVETLPRQHRLKAPYDFNKRPW